MDHTTGAPTPAQHSSVGVTPSAVQDHEVARHEATNPGPPGDRHADASLRR